MKDVVFITKIDSPERSERSAAYDLSVKSWKVWCDLNGCELFVLDQPVVDLALMKANFNRYYCFDLLGDYQYDQICLVDADTIVHPDCPNFFKSTDHRFSAVHNDGDYDWIVRSIENYQIEFQGQFVHNFDIWKYINSGFIVTNRSFKFINDTLLEFYWANADKLRSIQKKYGVGTDQPLINLFLNELDIDINLLPYQFNMQDMNRKNALQNMLFTRIPGVYHFNAIDGGPRAVNEWMNKTYNFFHDKDN